MKNQHNRPFTGAVVALLLAGALGVVFEIMRRRLMTVEMEKVPAVARAKTANGKRPGKRAEVYTVHRALNRRTRRAATTLAGANG